VPKVAPIVEHAAVVAPALIGTDFAAGLADGSVIATAALDGSPYVPHAQVADIALQRGHVGPRRIDSRGQTRAAASNHDDVVHKPLLFWRLAPLRMDSRGGSTIILTSAPIAPPLDRRDNTFVPYCGGWSHGFKRS